LQEKLSRLLQTPLGSLKEGLWTANKINVLLRELDEARQVLSNKVASFVVQLPDSIRARVLNTEQAFRFLRGLLNYAPYKAERVRLKSPRHFDFQFCDSTWKCYRPHLRLDDFFFRVLPLKEPPAQTLAHVLRGLYEIPCDFVITTEWKRASA